MARIQLKHWHRRKHLQLLVQKGSQNKDELMNYRCKKKQKGSHRKPSATGQTRLPGSYLDRWPHRHFSGRFAPHRMCLHSVAWGWCSSDSSSASHAHTQHCRMTRWSTWTSRRSLSDRRRGGMEGEGGGEVGGRDGWMRGQSSQDYPTCTKEKRCARIIVTAVRLFVALRGELMEKREQRRTLPLSKLELQPTTVNQNGFREQ